MNLDQVRLGTFCQVRQVRQVRLGRLGQEGQVRKVRLGRFCQVKLGRLGQVRWFFTFLPTFPQTLSMVFVCPPLSGSHFYYVEIICQDWIVVFISLHLLHLEKHLYRTFITPHSIPHALHFFSDKIILVCCKKSTITSSFSKIFIHSFNFIFNLFQTFSRHDGFRFEASFCEF